MASSNRFRRSQDAVSADCSQQKRQAGKRTQQLRQQSRPADGLSEHGIHIAEASDGHGWIDLTHGALESYRDRERH